MNLNPRSRFGTSGALSAYAAALLLMVTQGSLAAPTISSISGTAAEKSTITVTGSGFGSGPNVILYDDFEASGGVVGQAVSLAASTVGSWTDTVGVTPQYDSVARSGSRSIRIYRDGQTASLRKDFPAPATEVFFSFWVRVPSGTPFPGDSGGVNQFSSDSSWKFAWLIDSSYDGSSSDLCAPTHTGGGSFQLAGNDFAMTYLPKGSTWWSWNSWMRMSVWLRADPSNPTGPGGRYRWHVTSTERGQFEQAGSEAIFDSDGPSQKAFRYINMPGWIRSDGSSRPVYDDIYIATGSNAQARVEIGDASTYSASKQLTLLVPKSWSASSISVQLPTGAVPSSGAYLYVTDKDGNVNAQGYKLAGGIAPNPPSSVQVQ